MMLNRAFILIAALAVLPAAAADAPANQFDLDCHGTTVSSAEGQKAEATRFRVDLAEGKLCFGDCDFLKPVTHADAQSVEYACGTGEARSCARTIVPSLHVEHEKVVIARDALTYTRNFRATVGDGAQAVTVTADAKGTCTPAPFSSFPRDAVDG